MNKQITFGIKYTIAVDIIAILIAVFIGMAMVQMINSGMGLGSGDVWIPGLILVGLLVIAFSVLPIIALVKHIKGLLQLNEEARKNQITLSVLFLLIFPIGTILHGIALYFMLSDEETKRAFGIK